MGEHKRKVKTIQYTKRSAKLKATLLVLLISGAIAFGINYFQTYKKTAFIPFDPQRTKGSNNAPLQILEFVDFECAQCAIGSKVLQKSMTEHPQAIRLSMRYFTLGELNSTISAMYAECTKEQGKFWEFTDLLFERQAQWRTLLKIKPALNQIALDAKVSVDELSSCVDNPETEKRVKKDKKLGESRFIQSTPSYFINGELHVGVGSLRKALERQFPAKTSP